MKTLITNGQIITSTGIKKGSVLIEDSKIIKVIFNDEEVNYDLLVDALGNFISPGFIDIHTHGAGGYDYMDNTVEAIYAASIAHMAHGTTSIVPTTLTSTTEKTIEFLEMFESVEEKKIGYPNILGLHLEGPYFSYGQRGAQDPRYLRNPNKDEYSKILDSSSKIIRWSIAPELDGAMEFGKYISNKGINCSIAHTEATCEEVIEATKNGFNSLTHFYSGMNSVKRINAYRVAGAVEAGYLTDDLYVEVIADGSHLPKELLELIYKVKPLDKICLITDSMRAAGEEDGNYILGPKDNGIEVIVEDNVAKLKDRSAFAGSVATTDMLLKTMHTSTSAELYQVVNMLTINPATLINVDKRKGSIEANKDADIIIFDDNYKVKFVMVNGLININEM